MRRSATALGLTLAGCAALGCASLSFTGVDGPTPTPSPTQTIVVSPTDTPFPNGWSPYEPGAVGGPVVSLNGALQTTCKRILSTAANGSSVTLTDVTGLSGGEVVFLLQVQDAISPDYGTPDPSPLATLGSAGVWEIATLDLSVGNGGYSLKAPLLHRYHSTDTGGDAAELCTVTQLGDASVVAGNELSVAGWNGSVGGVIVLTVNGTLTVEGLISADDSGFTGGGFNGVDSSGASNITLALTYDGILSTGTPGRGGQKGGGADGRSHLLEGRGDVASAGGGGDAKASGGGGGGNAGGGGGGGIESSDTLALANGGIGGAAAVFDPRHRLLMGGGGGEGQNNGGSNIGAGGSGGGIILVIARHLAGSAGQLSADGLSGALGDSDGAGGGGAGGTIAIWTSSSTFSGAVTADGRSGGNNNQGTTKRGPGGGGGGGRIHLGRLPSAAPSAGGGAPGVCPMFGNTSYGATSGAAGVITTSN